MDPAKRKAALRAIENGIYLVGCTDGTVRNVFMGSWLTQCSFEPPLVAIGIKKGTQHHAFIREHGGFSVNILRQDQQDLAKNFFKHQEADGDTVAGVPFTVGAQTGAPLLESAPLWFEAKVLEWVERGDHALAVAEVVSAGGSAEGELSCLSEASSGWNYGG